MVGHQCIAFITDSVLLGIDLAQSSRLFATILADCLATTLAIVLEDHANAAEGLTAEHAEARVKLVHGVQVKYLRQCIFFLGAFIFQKYAVHLKRAGLLPSGGTCIAIRATVILTICW